MHQAHSQAILTQLWTRQVSDQPLCDVTTLLRSLGLDGLACLNECPTISQLVVLSCALCIAPDLSLTGASEVNRSCATYAHLRSDGSMMRSGEHAHAPVIGTGGVR